MLDIHKIFVSSIFVGRKRPKAAFRHEPLGTHGGPRPSAFSALHVTDLTVSKTYICPAISLANTDTPSRIRSGGTVTNDRRSVLVSGSLA